MGNGALVLFRWTVIRLSPAASLQSGRIDRNFFRDRARDALLRPGETDKAVQRLTYRSRAEYNEAQLVCRSVIVKGADEDEYFATGLLQRAGRGR